MKKTVVRMIAMLLFAVLTVGAIALTISAETDAMGGSWSNLTWTLDSSTGHLTISGSGAMNGFDLNSRAAWRPYKESIKKVTIVEGVTSVGASAFTDCHSLTEVVLPDSVTSIGDLAFTYCKALPAIVLPKNLRSIKESVFWGCTALTEIVIPDGVATVGNAAFLECENLTRVVIPDSVTTIEKSAFSSCQKLESIIYCGSEEQWNSVEKGIDWDRNTGAYTVSFHSYDNEGDAICNVCGYDRTKKPEMPDETTTVTEDGTEKITFYIEFPFHIEVPVEVELPFRLPGCSSTMGVGTGMALLLALGGAGVCLKRKRAD